MWEPLKSFSRPPTNPADDNDYALFVKKLKELTTVDLSQYKEAQMRRRLTSLRDKRGFSTFAAYFDALKRDRQLLLELLDKMTINVSEFWRNRNRWEVLERQLLPELLKRTRRLKCWSAACSTGEEPYTLAMILAERQALSGADLLATDIDDGALAKARTAVYTERSVREVPEHYLRRYFVRKQDQYCVVDDLKRHVRFQKHNLLLDRFEESFDLIICRNVLIYFTEDAKDDLYRKFAAALKPGGLFFVGSTEQIFNPERYGLESAETFFYRKS